VIEVRNVTKTFGAKLAVDDLSFVVRPGVVTGFLGPNGAGKSTTMRVILGLDRPDKGCSLVNGQPFASSRSALREVGALLDAKDVHGGRTAHNHLLALAQSNGIPKPRVSEVLEMVGMDSVADRRIRSYSLGMSQRLGIAAALLGDPPVLLFDEPINGLDPAGILWIRGFMRSMAAQGRTMLVSSHLMSEMALTAEHLIVIGRGRLLADVSTATFIEQSSTGVVRIRSPHGEQLLTALRRAGAPSAQLDGDYLEVRELTCEQVGDIAAASGATVHELYEQKGSLEGAFMEMTKDSAEYEAAST
jgi:ABC-2 type transport system ATP-binding protein